ncbi:MAG: L-fucose/L-arabinose isomerase family protein [Nitrososphaerota archaeon]|nr:L-fucose/L-arabinose isomerase family protein [Candidatus Bathyarchaeota archaeon]MDW8048181.1 L-fucose/L-arabinose isomerase family protein [Nitrososphaerota archaeon]
MPTKEKLKIRIGFIPAHRSVFSWEWATDMRRRCITALSKNPHLELIVPDEDLTKKGLVSNLEDAEKTIKLFRKREIDGILIGTMTFGDEVAALEVASAFSDLPVMLFGTKEGPFTEEGGRLSDSFCGTLSISSGLYRRKIKYLFAGIVFPEEESFIKAVDNFVRVCAIRKGFIGAKIGQVGPRPQPFETCIFNESALIEKFKQRVVPITLTEIFDRANKLSESDPEVQGILTEMKNQADLSHLSREQMMKIAKLELVLKEYAKSNGITAMGVQCWNAMEEIYGICPCYAMGRLTDQGIMCSCEVDIYGALTMLIQYLASLKETPPHFIDWTIKHQEKENVFLAWHCGNAPPSLAAKGCPIIIKYQSVLGRTLGIDRSYGAAEFQLKSGTVTICRLVEYDGKFKMLITRGEIERSDQTLRGSWSWVKVPNLDLLYRRLAEEGFIHHASMIHGDYVQPIHDACKTLDIEPVVV